MFKNTTKITLDKLRLNIAKVCSFIFYIFNLSSFIVHVVEQSIKSSTLYKSMLKPDFQINARILFNFDFNFKHFHRRLCADLILFGAFRLIENFVDIYFIK